MSISTSRAFRAPLYLLLFFSGCAGLGYELSWAHLFSASFGNEIIAVLAVIAAFFTGCALGAWGMDGYIRRSSAPWRWYAGCEMLIGLWALALTALIPKINTGAALLTGTEPSLIRHWFVSFILPLLLLLPATAAMGATFPATEKLLAAFRDRNASVGGLYAANTFGACIGVIATTFLLIPLFGYRATQFVFILMNIMCAAGMLLFARRFQIISPPSLSLSPQPARSLLLVLFITGLLGIGYEVVLIRVMSHVLENTVYSFAASLSIYLMGTAAGAAVYQRFLSSLSYERCVSLLLPCTAAACCLGMVLLSPAADMYHRLRDVAAGSFTGSVLCECAFAGSVFLFPTLCMGALYSCLIQRSCILRQSAGTSVAVNTLGAALSPVMFGVVAISFLGTKIAMLASAGGYLLLVPFRSLIEKPVGIFALAIAIVAFVMHPGIQVGHLPDGLSVVAHKDGVMASVTVVEDNQGDRYLTVNNRFTMGSTATQTADRRQAHIPLLLHPAPRRALFLGLGTGATFSAAAAYEQLTAVGVEIIPEVIDVLPLFEKANGNLNHMPMLRIVAADARRYVRACPPQCYDVVIADLFHPSLDGAGLLYTVEHFEAVRRVLAPGGIFCQWLPLYQLDAQTLKIIVRTFLHVFPDTSAFLCTYSIEMPLVGLVAGIRQYRYHDAWMENRLAYNLPLAEELKRLRLITIYDLFGTFVGGHQALASYAGSGNVNTDDRPLVVFNAPVFVYAGSQLPPYVLLQDMCSSLHPKPEDIISNASPDTQYRLASYWQARDLFLHTGIALNRTQDPQNLPSRITGPLLECVMLSPDFSSAYEPLLAIAVKTFATDRQKALSLLLELERMNPHRSDAKRIRTELFGK
ncbi:MAG: methyltransferase domain-containing protein [Desulfobacterota bacterium]|nr:methyltransferase domain-containing protein [Thermodesulfobacteriota bacterium]